MASRKHHQQQPSPSQSHSPPLDMHTFFMPTPTSPPPPQNPSPPLPPSLMVLPPQQIPSSSYPPPTGTHHFPFPFPFPFPPSYPPQQNPNPNNPPPLANMCKDIKGPGLATCQEIKESSG
ncbi:hypothetical protein NC652_028589 [Populus alba x Populus x berolinensis]|nr:hypothetical protein NC652_028589 [Populus alba x Populus x berolinensis]